MTLKKAVEQKTDIRAKRLTKNLRAKFGTLKLLEIVTAV